MARKRGQNEGTIYPRKDGTWCAQVTIEGKRLTKYSKSKKECREWRDETLSKIQNGLSFAGAQTTILGYFDEWLKAIKPSLKPKTWLQYEQVSRVHILPHIGKFKLKDLRPDHIQSLYNQKLEEGKSLSTLRIIHAVLHRSLNQAIKWGLIGTNPTDAVSRPKPKKREMKVLNEIQVLSFLSVEKGTRYEALYHLAIATGLRQGEILGLRWSDLDWQSGHLQVQRQLQQVLGKGLMFTEPKSKAGRRLVVLGQATCAKLQLHNEIQHEERLLAGDRWVENDLIFPSTIGTPLGPRNLFRHFKAVLLKAGLPEIRFHDLRHTAATLMLQQGVHPKVVQERLGHSSISLTLDTYSHVIPSMQQEAADKMDELLTPVAVMLQ